MATTNLDEDIDPITGLPRLKRTGTTTTTDAGAEKTTPPSATSLGEAYVKQVAQRMQGNDPAVQNARAQTESQKAVQNYLSKKTAAQTTQQAGFDAGTLQHQRVHDRAAATAQEANLGLDRLLGDYTRARSTEALGLAKGIEDQERADIGSLIASLSDNPVAQNILRRVAAQGGDVRAAYAQMFAEGGGEFLPQYRPQNPAETKLQGIKDELAIMHPDWSPEQIDAEARALFTQRTNDEDAGAKSTRNQQLANDALKRFNSGASWDSFTPQEQELLKQEFTARPASSIPTNEAEINARIDATDTRQRLFNVDGQLYELKGYHQQTRWRKTAIGKDNEHYDWAVVRDVTTGQTKYISSKLGVVLDYMPPVPSDRGMKAEYDKARGVWTAKWDDGISTGTVYDPQTQQWIPDPQAKRK